MNAKEKKRVVAIADLLESSAAAFEHTLEELATMQQEEQERFDALGDKAQEGERGQKLASAADALQSAADHAQEAFDGLNEASSDLRGIE